MPESAVYVLEKMSHGYRRTGRDARAGFYDYAESGSPQLWTGLKTFERGSRKVDAADVADRLRFAVTLEARRSSVTADDGWHVLPEIPAGLPLAAAEAARVAAGSGSGSDDGFTRRAAELADRYGPRFVPEAPPARGAS